MSLVVLPRLKVITGGEQVESKQLRPRTKFHEFCDRELFMGEHEPHEALLQSAEIRLVG